MTLKDTLAQFEEVNAREISREESRYKRKRNKCLHENGILADFLNKWEKTDVWQQKEQTRGCLCDKLTIQVQEGLSTASKKDVAAEMTMDVIQS